MASTLTNLLYHIVFSLQVSTLQRLIHALGGELELIAHLPGGDIRIRQFTGA